ncbi:FAD binding domain-containing protein [Chloroflexota bacterium]
MRFEYLAPATIAEAVSLLVKHNGKARVIATGTDLLVKVANRSIEAEYVVDITAITGLDYIELDEKGGLKIGALATMRTLETSAELGQSYPIISQAAGNVASVAIRNIATVGGNLCNAAPSADTAPALIALTARVRLVGPDGERVVPLEDFFTGPGSTALKTGELLVEIIVSPPLPHTKGAYLKHSIRGTVDLAIVGVAVVATLEPDRRLCRDIKIVLGAVAPVPLRALEAEEVLRGKKITPALTQQCARVAAGEAHPISDVRASAEYRTKMVRVITERAIREATDG